MVTRKRFDPRSALPGSPFENGTGKSTLLEAIAWSVGFAAQGGNRDQSFAENADGYTLGRALRLNWRQKVSGGFFLRAETFFNFSKTA
jgi:predicted ATPase